MNILRGTFEEVNLEGSYVCPGFLDGHIHLESSMVSPSEFERAVLPHGTTCGMVDVEKQKLVDVFF